MPVFGLGLDVARVVALAGDWHGHLPWARSRVAEVGGAGVRTLVHVGDFGIWPGASGSTFVREVDRSCARYDLALLVVPGNHEDWGRLTRLWAEPANQNETGDPRPLYLSEHIAVLPRGWRWTMGGRSFVALGGAPSIDYAWRTEGTNWWPEEMITATDVERTVEVGYADVMVTHDAPRPPWVTPGVADVLAANPMGLSDRELAYAREGAERLDDAFVGVAPRLLVHGHFHVASETTVHLPGVAHETRIWSLPAQNAAGNVRLLDLGTLTDAADP